MKKRLLPLLILTMALFLGNSQKAKADVTNLPASDGWIRLEAMPDNWNDYYYVIADWKQNLMMQLRMGASQGTSYNALWYEAPQDPFREKTVVWTFEKTLKSDGVTVYWLLRNEAYPDYFLQTESNAMYYYHTHDNGGGDKSWGRLTIKTRVTNGAFQYFYIKNGKDGGNLYLGPWDDNANADNLPLHSETALNKSESLQGHFIIYAIKKTDYNAKRAAILEEALDNATAEEPQDISFLIDNPKMELALSGTKWVKEAGAGSQGGPAANRIFRFYNETGKISQTITGLRDGIYRVKCSSFYREGSAKDAQALYDAGTEQHYGVVFANDAQAPVKSIFAGAKSARDDANGFSLHQGSYYIPDGTTNLALAIATGAYDGNEVEVAVSGGTLKFGVMNTQHVNLDYLPMDNFELWYCGPFQTGIHELGAPSMNMSAKGYITTGVPAAFQLTFPNNVSSDGEAISLISAAGITVDGAAASATFTDGTLSFAIPNSIGTHTITVPAQTLGFATSRVYNETITLTYTVIQPTLPEAKRGYLYAMVNDAPRFMTRGDMWSTRAVLGDYGIPVEVAPTDGQNFTTIKFLDRGDLLYSAGKNGDLYTDGSTTATEFQIFKVGEGQYKLKANNSVIVGYLGVQDKFEIYQNKSEADALVWQFMDEAQYKAYKAQTAESLKLKALTAAGITSDDLASAFVLPIKSSEDTETQTIAESYYEWSKWALFSKTWTYDVEPGLYRVKMNGFVRSCGADNYSQMVKDGLDGHMGFLSVNGDSILVHSVWDGRQTTSIASGASSTAVYNGTTYYYPFDQTAAGYLYSNTDRYSNEMLVNVGSEGKLNIRIYNESKGDMIWYSYRDLTVDRIIVSLEQYKTIAIDEINGYTELPSDVLSAGVTAVNNATTIAEVGQALNTVRDAENARQYGITDWANTSITADIENEAIKPLMAADYSWLGAKYVVTEENRSLNDKPRAITIPVQRSNENVTVSITETPGDYIGCFTTTASAVNGAIDCHYNGIPGHTYYYKVENAAHNVLTQGQVSITGMLRMIYSQGGSNIRDLGGRITVDGKRVKYGRIFRGGEMHNGKQTNMTAADIAEMQRLGIVAELDLRQDGEINNTSNTQSAIPGAAYCYVNLVPSGTEIIRDSQYHGKIRDGIHFIAENLKRGNVYYHCIWGADRTGAMSMFLECILGVQLTDIEKDYQLTSFSKAGLRPSGGFNLNGKIMVIRELGYEGNTIQEQVVSFLKAIGVTDDDIATIRQELLEENDDAMASYVGTLKTAYGKVAAAAGVTLDASATTIAAATADVNAKMAALTQTTDITAVLHNPDFEENGGSTDNWSAHTDGLGKGGSANHVGRIFDKTGSIEQTLQNMPAGTYIVKAQAFDRKGSGASEETKGANYGKYLSGEAVADAYLIANGSKTILRNVYEDALPTTFDGCYNPTYGIYVPENSTGGAVAMASTTDGGRLYWNVATVTLEKAGDLNIGINVPTNAGGDYVVFDNFKLYYQPQGAETPVLNLDETATASAIPAIDGYYNLTSNRTLAAGKWNTLCLPFDLSAAQIEALPITEVRAISDVTTSGDDATVKFVPVTEIKAGKPYIVKVSEAWNVALDNILVRAKSPVATMYENGLSMLGNYSKTVLNGQYYISSDKFYYADVNVNMKGFRASLTVPEGTAIKAFGIDTEDIVDAIEALNREEQDGAVYDILGRRLPSVKSAHGIYIKNGRKFIK